MKQIKRIMGIDPWKITSNQIEKEDRRLQESLTSIGNGYMGMRGNFSETYSGDSHQGTYIAGVWFPDKTRVGWWKNGYPEYFGKAINALNFASVRVFIDDKEVDLAASHVTDFNMPWGTHLYLCSLWSTCDCRKIFLNCSTRTCGFCFHV